MNFEILSSCHGFHLSAVTFLHFIEEARIQRCMHLFGFVRILCVFDGPGHLSPRIVMFLAISMCMLWLDELWAISMQFVVRLSFAIVAFAYSSFAVPCSVCIF